MFLQLFFLHSFIGNCLPKVCWGENTTVHKNPAVFWSAVMRNLWHMWLRSWQGPLYLQTRTNYYEGCEGLRQAWLQWSWNSGSSEKRQDNEKQDQFGARELCLANLITFSDERTGWWVRVVKLLILTSVRLSTLTAVNSSEKNWWNMD